MPTPNLMMNGLLPPAMAAAAMAAKNFAVQQQQSLPVSTVPTSSVQPSARLPGLTAVSNNVGRATSRTSPTKIPRVGQGQVTCNCGTVFPNLEMLELHAKAVHPENTNLVSKHTKIETETSFPFRKPLKELLFASKFILLYVHI